MNYLQGIIAAGLLTGFVASTSAQNPADRDVLYQLSSMSALKAGVYDGFDSYANVKTHGDFGIGAFENMNGEMVELGGVIYQIQSDGKVYRPDDSIGTCYATVKFFHAEKTVSLDQPLDYSQLKTRLDDFVSTNVPCAIRIEGAFEYVKTRSVRQQKKPYPPLDEVIKNQVVFEFTNVIGIAVGFRYPAFMNGVQAPGYHLHFLTRNQDGGGHLLECRLKNVRVDIDSAREFLMDLRE